MQTTVQYNHRNLHFFSCKEDIQEDPDKIKIIKYKNNGYFFIKQNCFYDSNGRFDYSFDNGLWKSKFLESSNP